MKHTTLQRTLAGAYCTLLLAILLLMAACGGGYSSPGGSPANPTPTKGGYTLVTLLERDLQVFDHAIQSILTP
jgi:hypothetical protein